VPPAAAVTDDLFLDVVVVVVVVVDVVVCVFLLMSLFVFFCFCCLSGFNVKVGLNLKKEYGTVGFYKFLYVTKFINDGM
jgi:hypothetical protein